MANATISSTAVANLRHLYAQMIGGQVRDTASAKRIAEGLLGPAIESLERTCAKAPAFRPGIALESGEFIPAEELGGAISVKRLPADDTEGGLQ